MIRRLALVPAAALLVLTAACGSTDDTTATAPTTTAPAGTGSSGASTGDGGDGGTEATTAVPATEAPATTVDPGTLPQTDEKPSADDPVFREHAELLWQAIVEDDPAIALPFFFPQAAYLQVKQISDPAKDYQNRLIRYYEEDIHTLHRQLGANASKATFDGLEVNEANAAWIKPGVEYNKGSYWRVQYNNLRYTLAGKAQSFPVVSMISWRGQWYVVHLSSIR